MENIKSRATCFQLLIKGVRSSSNLPVHEVKYKAYASDDVYLKPAHLHTDETRASEILLLIEQKPFLLF
jgi:hypothetical protein